VSILSFEHYKHYETFHNHSRLFHVVIQALDELKKFNPGAREAIKYLEQELKKGNRYMVLERNKSVF
jgi:hypothetical protein